MQWPRDTISYSDVARLSGFNLPNVTCFYTSIRKSIPLTPTQMVDVEADMMITATAKV